MQYLFCKCSNHKSKYDVLGMDVYLCIQCVSQYSNIIEEGVKNLE